MEIMQGADSGAQASLPQTQGKVYQACKIIFLLPFLVLTHTVAYTQHRWKMPPPKQFLSALLEKGEMSTYTFAGTSRNWTRPWVLKPFPYPQWVGTLTSTIRENPNQSCSFRLPSLALCSGLWASIQKPQSVVWDTFFYSSCFMFLK